jgi:hypothetical protein
MGCAVALATKEMAAALPGIAFVLTVACQSPARWRRAVRGAGALGGVLLAYVLLRVFFVGSLRSYHEPNADVVGQVLRFLREALLACGWPGDRVRHADPDGLRLGFLVAGAALVALGAHAWRRWRAVAAACAAAFVVSLAPVATWAGLSPGGEGARLLYPSLMFVAVAVGAAAAHARWRLPGALAALGLVAAAFFGLRRALEPWRNAATTMAAIVHGLNEAAAGKRLLVLCADLPPQHGPAYLAQNAFPAAAWLFVQTGVRVEQLLRPQWEAAVAEHRALLANDNSVAALRWDRDSGRWVGPSGK